MVEIIRQGQIPEEQVFEATCTNCKTHFRFKRKEAKYVSDQRDGDFLEIPCPLCSKTVYKSPSSPNTPYGWSRYDR